MSPEPKKKLFYYLVVSEVAVSITLVVNRGGVERLVYYASKMLNEVETQCSSTMKLILALVNGKKEVEVVL